MKGKISVLSIFLLFSIQTSAQQENFQNLYLNPQLGASYGYTPRYAYKYSPTYDSSTNWQRGWIGPYYAGGLRCYPGQGCEAATYPPLYGSARYNPYADDRNVAMYEQTRDVTRQFLQANEVYDDLNYPAKQMEYMRFAMRTDPRYYWLWTPFMYPYGKKPYYRKYGTNPEGQGNVNSAINPFWGTLYARNFHCHGPNYGCEVHNVFPDSN